MLMMMWSNRKSRSFLVVGMQNGTATSEDSLAVSYITQQQPANTFLGIYPRELETCPQKYPHMDVYRSLFITASKQPR